MVLAQEEDLAGELLTHLAGQVGRAEPAVEAGDIGVGLFELGMFFSIAMGLLAGGAILYDTSNVLHHYPEDRYVSASLQLFASGNPEDS